MTLGGNMWCGDGGVWLARGTVAIHWPTAMVELGCTVVMVSSSQAAMRITQQNKELTKPVPGIFELDWSWTAARSTTDCCCSDVGN